MARIAGVNIPQNKLVHIGLTYIYGIGNKFSKQICTELEIPKSKRVNELTDDQILKIREYIDQKFTVEGDLRRETSLSIKRLIDLATYRGSRPRKKLPVRGLEVFFYVLNLYMLLNQLIFLCLKNVLFLGLLQL